MQWVKASFHMGPQAVLLAAGLGACMVNHTVYAVPLFPICFVVPALQPFIWV
jgi:hypothetical protein